MTRFLEDMASEISLADAEWAHEDPAGARD